MKYRIAAVLAFSGALLATTINPGRIVQGGENAPGVTQSIAAGERVSFYFVETYSVNVPIHCPSCPAQASDIFSMAWALPDSVGKSMTVDLLTYAGDPALSFDAVFSPDILSYTRDGVRHEDPIAFWRMEYVPFSWGDLFAAHPRRFRLDLTNTSDIPLQLGNIHVGFLGGILSSGVGPAPPFVPDGGSSQIPEPMSILLTGSGLLAAALLSRRVGAKLTP